MLSITLKSIFKGLSRRYRYTYRRDKQNLLRVTAYYSNTRRFVEMFYIYNIFEITFFVLRFAFKVVFWWPLLWPYIVFCYMVRYIFIPWHYLFLDVILPSLELRLGGAHQAKKSYFYFSINLIYLTIAWIEKFLVNFFGVRLIWRWWRNLLWERIPDFIGRNSDNIAYGVLHIIEAFIWIWKTWSRLWDYVMSWFNPWSYWKTRYYLSAYFRDKVGRRYTYYRLIFDLANHNNKFLILHYMALYFYGIALFFLNLKFFFGKFFIIVNYKYYRYNNIGKIQVSLNYKIEQLIICFWAVFPNFHGLILSGYWKALYFSSFIIKPCLRFFYNYKLSYNWRWIKLRKKGEELGLGKHAGKWYPWLVNRRKS